MNASLLAALASPGARTPGSAAKSKRAGGGNEENNRSVRGAGAGRAGGGSGGSNDGDGERKSDVAPAFTVREPPSTPGRMENLRVLIEEGKRAAAEGRLAAALRKYETAMVTLPEAYKPRLRKKIARLEAQLDAEEDRSPGTPARVSRACRAEGAEASEKCPGPLDLLHIAVQDVAAAAEASGRSTSALNTGALSTFSPRRSSPLVRGLTPSSRLLSSLPDDLEPPMPQCGDHQHDDADENRGAEKNGDGDNDVGRLGKILASRLTMAPPPPQGARAGSREEVQASPSAGTNIRTDSVWRLAATSRERAGVCSEGGGQDGGHEGHFGLGAAGGGVDDVDVADTAGMDKQERMRAINKGLSDKLEQQVVTIMNEASSEELTELHGIGLRRAQLILQTRATAPFRTLADLTRIGMYPKQIEKMGKHNMLECLDVYPARPESPHNNLG